MLKYLIDNVCNSEWPEMERRYFRTLQSIFQENPSLKLPMHQARLRAKVDPEGNGAKKGTPLSGNIAMCAGV